MYRPLITLFFIIIDELGQSKGLKLGVSRHNDQQMLERAEAAKEDKACATFAAM